MKIGANAWPKGILLLIMENGCYHTKIMGALKWKWNGKYSAVGSILWTSYTIAIESFKCVSDSELPFISLTQTQTLVCHMHSFALAFNWYLVSLGNVNDHLTWLNHQIIQKPPIPIPKWSENRSKSKETSTHWNGSISSKNTDRGR